MLRRPVTKLPRPVTERQDSDRHWTVIGRGTFAPLCIGFARSALPVASLLYTVYNIMFPRSSILYRYSYYRASPIINAPTFA